MHGINTVTMLSESYLCRATLNDLSWRIRRSAICWPEGLLQSFFFPKPLTDLSVVRLMSKLHPVSLFPFAVLPSGFKSRIFQSSCILQVCLSYKYLSFRLYLFIPMQVIEAWGRVGGDVCLHSVSIAALYRV